MKSIKSVIEMSTYLYLREEIKTIYFPVKIMLVCEYSFQGEKVKNKLYISSLEEY
jgi:hypothetical protein